MPILGELAALATAFLWSATSLFFAEAGRRIGAFRVNKIRLVMATVLYAALLTLRTGTPWPTGIPADAAFWLCLSSLIGIVIGDSLLFKAFVLIGPRLTTLVFASSPILATVIAWFFLGEKLGLLDLAGVVVTLSGIAWVVSERRFDAALTPADRNYVPRGKPFALGIVYAFGGALGQAAGLVTSKQGMLGTGTVIPPFEAAFVRILFAVVAIWLISAVSGQLKPTFAAMKNRPAMLLTFGGTVVGPFLGIWMSLVAVSLIEAGIAATLMAMVPVLVIPLVVLLHRERVSFRAVFGAVVAVGGVALIFLH
jgi:drug/metabolite transporter (DMT)-like permease